MKRKEALFLLALCIFVAGQFTQSVSGITTTTPPDAVTTFSSPSRTATSISLTWIAPNGGGLPISYMACCVASGAPICGSTTI